MHINSLNTRIAYLIIMKKEILFEVKRYEDPKLQKKYEKAVKDGLFDKLKMAREKFRKEGIR